MKSSVEIVFGLLSQYCDSELIAHCQRLLTPKQYPITSFLSYFQTNKCKQVAGIYGRHLPECALSRPQIIFTIKTRHKPMFAGAHKPSIIEKQQLRRTAFVWRPD